MRAFSIDPYVLQRGNLRTMDKLLFAGKGFISEQIEHLTKSRYSHIAGVRVDNGRVMLFEATSKGMIYRPLSRVDGTKYEYISIHRVTPDVSFNENAYVGAMLDLLGIDYGASNIGKIYFHEKLHLPVDIHDKILNTDNLNSVICSQAQSIGDRAAGFDPCPEKSDSFTYPCDFEESRSWCYKEIGRFRL